MVNCEVEKFGTVKPKLRIRKCRSPIEYFFLNTAISRMEKEMEEKKNLTKNFLDDFLKK